MKTLIRVRFAPSPTGIMHLGNIRAALINYLYARQKNGTFILRIEDTDPERNVDPDGKKIISDLKWIGLDYDEGPDKEGSFGPYLQSQRTSFYKEHLKMLQDKNLAYRCFCTLEELEKKRLRQLALKQPPRYDRTCFRLSQKEIDQNLNSNMPYIWRFNLSQDNEKDSASSNIIEIYDIARGTIKFDLRNFSDFALTRNDGSFTFMFANFVDDLTMKITHVFRGEDHLTNTAGQAALYRAFEAQIPVFWHLPIMINIDGKKLSKRDFGFSLNDLRDNGFMPEAICNYLAIIGGSFKQEIMPLKELVNAINFDAINSTGQIRYDLEKLRWVNHHWIINSDISTITLLCKPFLKKAYGDAKIEEMSPQKLLKLVSLVKDELFTLQEIVSASKFYFERPIIEENLLNTLGLDQYKSTVISCMKDVVSSESDSAAILQIIQELGKQYNIPNKNLFMLLRIALTGKPMGLGVKDLFSILDTEEIKYRLFNL